jgi:hypothetical protein
LLPASHWFLVWRVLRPWIWRQYISPKRRLTFGRLYGTISEKTEPFNTNMTENLVWNFYFVYVDEYKHGVSINMWVKYAGKGTLSTRSFMQWWKMKSPRLWPCGMWCSGYLPPNYTALHSEDFSLDTHYHDNLKNDTVT